MQVSSDSSTTAPDWSTQAEEIHCPLCEYNLRGLTEPRCPECGYQFDWSDLTDPARKLHPYLFEHHPRRNLRSFLRTVIGQLRPRRFWQSLRADMPTNRRRLMLYWLLLVAATCAVPMMRIGIFSVNLAIEYQKGAPRERLILQSPQRAQDLAEIIASYGSLEAYIQAAYPTPASARFWAYVFKWTNYEFTRTQTGTIQGQYVIAVGLFLTWPWLTLLVMSIFRPSMRLARINSEHFMRVVVYSSDVILMPVLALLVFETMWTSAWWRGTYFGGQGYIMSWAILAMKCMFFYRLIEAHRFYLKIKPVAATLLASQFIVALIVVAIILYVPGLFEFMLANRMGLILW